MKTEVYITVSHASIEVIKKCSKENTKMQTILTVIIMPKTMMMDEDIWYTVCLKVTYSFNITVTKRERKKHPMDIEYIMKIMSPAIFPGTYTLLTISYEMVVLEMSKQTVCEHAQNRLTRKHMLNAIPTFVLRLIPMTALIPIKLCSRRVIPSMTILRVLTHGDCPSRFRPRYPSKSTLENMDSASTSTLSCSS